MTNRENWDDAFAASPERDADFTTLSGRTVDGVYGPDDGEFPGEYPYTRGPYASMYRSKLWTMRMFAGFGIAPDTNRRFHDLLANGGDGFQRALADPATKVEILWQRPPLHDLVAESLEHRGGTLRPSDYLDRAHPRAQLPGPRPICRKTE